MVTNRLKGPGHLFVDLIQLHLVVGGKTDALGLGKRSECFIGFAYGYEQGSADNKQAGPLP